MKKISVLIMLFILLLSFSCKKNDNSIKIGFVGTMSGDAGDYGKLMSQAIKIAVEEKNAAGGIAGNKVEFIIEDDEGKVDKASAALDKLANKDKIFGLVGAVFSNCSLAIAPKAESEKIVMITPSSTNKKLIDDKKFVFRDVLSDALQAKTFAKYVYYVIGIKKVAILFLKNDYSQGVAEDFKEQFESEGGVIVAMESGFQGDKDFNIQLTKIKGTNPEALFFPCYIFENIQILEQAKNLDLNVKMLSTDKFSDPEVLNLANELADGVILSNSADESQLISNKRNAFEEKYDKKWKEKPGGYSMNSYDAANILINAIEKVYNKSSKKDQVTLNLDRDKIRDCVAGTVNFEGVSGNVTFLPSGDAIKNVGIFKVDAKNKKYDQIAIYKMDEKENLTKVR
jgi:branched-chain amino acid transport system substrate-binding protein